LSRKTKSGIVKPPSIFHLPQNFDLRRRSVPITVDPDGGVRASP
jgi:hypothetical protein